MHIHMDIHMYMTGGCGKNGSMDVLDLLTHLLTYLLTQGVCGKNGSMDVLDLLTHLLTYLLTQGVCGKNGSMDVLDFAEALARVGARVYSSQQVSSQVSRLVSK